MLSQMAHDGDHSFQTTLGTPTDTRSGQEAARGEGQAPENATGDDEFGSSEGSSFRFIFLKDQNGDN